MASFITTRSRNCELWFIKNKPLEEAVLGYLAKFKERYEVKVYGFAIEGNHTQAPMLFPKGNRAPFMRDFNSCVARAVPRFTPQYPGGRFWGRRYSGEFLPGDADVEEYFFYTVLQPVQDGLVERISDYPGYNCFHDAIYGVKRKFKVVRWAEYNAAKRYNPHVKIKDYMDIVILQYERLPGYEHLSQREYATLMLAKLEERRTAIVKKRREKGLGFVGRDKLLQKKRGTPAQNPKTSDINSPRPRVLSVCPKRWAECLAWYFEVYHAYKAASERYRAGDLTTEFPPGTYRPYYHPPP